MKYSVVLTSRAKKQLEKLDKPTAKLISSWLIKNLQGCEDPRKFGKPLVADKSGQWRYRIGDYRVIAEIEDENILIRNRSSKIRVQKTWQLTQKHSHYGCAFYIELFLASMYSCSRAECCCLNAGSLREMRFIIFFALPKSLLSRNIENSPSLRLLASAIDTDNGDSS